MPPSSPAASETRRRSTLVAKLGSSSEQRSKWHSRQPPETYRNKVQAAARSRGQARSLVGFGLRFVSQYRWHRQYPAGLACTEPALSAWLPCQPYAATATDYKYGTHRMKPCADAFVCTPLQSQILIQSESTLHYMARWRAASPHEFQPHSGCGLAQ